MKIYCKDYKECKYFGEEATAIAEAICFQISLEVVFQNINQLERIFFHFVLNGPRR
jgi:hypothetical protein